MIQLWMRILSDDLYRLNFTIDATKLRHGINKGRLIIEDTCHKMSIPIQVMMQEGGLRAEQKRQEKRAVIALMKNYIDLKFHKITRNIWVERAAEAIGQLQDLNPDNLMAQLYQVQILATRERYNEAGYWLDKLEPDAFGKESDMLVKCYYLYLETLLNKDESYLQAVTDEIEQIYRRDETQWYLAWFLLYFRPGIYQESGSQMESSGETVQIRLLQSGFVLRGSTSFPEPSIFYSGIGAI